jgi:hypothetical protein
VSPRQAAALVLLLPPLLLAACAPKAPKGVERASLDEAVARAIGDPSTCVMMAEAPSGRVVYRYGSHVTCGRKLPMCEGESEYAVSNLLRAASHGIVAADSCPTVADGSRTVGWAAGPARPGLVYAAVMEGERALPGRVMADRLQVAFRRAGVSAPARKAP